MGDSANKEEATSARNKIETSATVTITTEKRTETKQVVFNTPTLLKAIEDADEDSTIRIAVKDSDTDAEPRVMLDAGKGEVVERLTKSIVPADQIGIEMRKFAQFLLEHSTLKAIGVHAINIGSDGNDAGWGFVATAPDCSVAHAISLVNCGDANIDEFIAAAGITVPGRSGEPEKGEIVAPTPEQVEKLG